MQTLNPLVNLNWIIQMKLEEFEIKKCRTFHFHVLVTITTAGTETTDTTKIKMKAAERSSGREKAAAGFLTLRVQPSIGPWGDHRVCCLRDGDVRLRGVRL